jgi:hypothetical protein
MKPLHRVLILAAAAACASREPGEQSDSASVDNAGAPSVAVLDSGAARLEPRDDANPSFREFRGRLMSALDRRDTAFLHAIVAPEIRTSFGAEGGAGHFREMWRTSEPSSPVWLTLTRVLRMGGKHSSDSMFLAPYVYARWPDSIDAFSHVAVTRENAPVHGQPNAGSPVLGTATYSILRAVEWTTIPGDAMPSDTSWVKVEMPDTRSGWMRVADVYSPVSWRVAFALRGASWLMILFVAGD